MSTTNANTQAKTTRRLSFQPVNTLPQTFIEIIPGHDAHSSAHPWLAFRTVVYLYQPASSDHNAPRTLNAKMNPPTRPAVGFLSSTTTTSSLFSL